MRCSVARAFRRNGEKVIPGYRAPPVFVVVFLVVSVRARRRDSEIILHGRPHRFEVLHVSDFVQRANEPKNLVHTSCSIHGGVAYGRREVRPPRQRREFMRSHVVTVFITINIVAVRLGFRVE